MEQTEDAYDFSIVLGKGGFGKVIKGTHRITKREVAIKIIPISALKTADLQSRVENEIKIHRKLHHQNIIEMYDAFVENNQYYLVMECAKDQNLFHYLNQNGKFSEEKAVKVNYQLLLAIQHLHQHHIVHRDVKLSNILIAKVFPQLNSSLSRQSPPSYQQGKESRGSARAGEHDLLIKLCDFGLAIEISHPDDDHYTYCGTPSYMAPEIAKQVECGYPVDIWGVGIIFSALLTGDPPSLPSLPISTPGLTKVSQVAQEGRPVDGANLPDGVSRTAKDFTRAVLSENPKMRPKASDLLSHALFQKYREELSMFTEANTSFTHTTNASSSLSLQSISPSPLFTSSSIRHATPLEPSPASLEPQQNLCLKESRNQSDRKHGTLGSALHHKTTTRLNYSMDSFPSNEDAPIAKSSAHRNLRLSLEPSLSNCSSRNDQCEARIVWQKVKVLTKDLPSFFFYLPSESSASTTLYGIEEAMFLTKEGDMYYFYKQIKLYLQLGDGTEMLRLGKWSSEEKQSVFSFLSVPSTSDPSSNLSSSLNLISNRDSEGRKTLYLFNENNYPFAASSSSPTKYRKGYQPADNSSIFELPSFPKVYYVPDLIFHPIDETISNSRNKRSSRKLIAALLLRLLGVVERVMNRIPKLIMYACSKPIEPDQRSRTHQLRQSFSVILGGQSIKCMFMSNQPMPDLHIQWGDGTRLVYRLQSNHLSIFKPRTQSAPSLRWDGSFQFFPSNSVSTSSTQYIPELLQRYMIISQQVVLRCMKEERRISEGRSQSARRSSDGNNYHDRLKGPIISFLD